MSLNEALIIFSFNNVISIHNIETVNLDLYSIVIACVEIPLNIRKDRVKGSGDRVHWKIY